MLKAQTVSDTRSWYNIFDPVLRPMSTCYRALCHDEQLLLKTLIKWSDEFPNLNVEDFRNYILRIYTVSNVAKFRSFQYKFIFKVIFTNTRLFKMGIKETKMCTFCKQEDETLKHLFWDCKMVKEFWYNVTQLLEITAELGWQDIVFLTITDNAKLIQNFIVLLAKFFIFHAKCAEESLSFNRFQVWIKSIRDLELEIAKSTTKNPFTV